MMSLPTSTPVEHGPMIAATLRDLGEWRSAREVYHAVLHRCSGRTSLTARGVGVKLAALERRGVVERDWRTGWPYMWRYVERGR